MVDITVASSIFYIQYKVKISVYKLQKTNPFEHSFAGISAVQACENSLKKCKHEFLPQNEW